jgi:hypothetical protein
MEIYGGDKCNGNRKRKRWLLKKLLVDEKVEVM